MSDDTRAADLTEMLRQALEIMTPNQVASLEAGIAFAPGMTHRKAALEMIATLKG